VLYLHLEMSAIFCGLHVGLAVIIPLCEVTCTTLRQRDCMQTGVVLGCHALAFMPQDLDEPREERGAGERASQETDDNAWSKDNASPLNAAGQAEVPDLLLQRHDGLLQAHVEAQPLAQVVADVPIRVRLRTDAGRGALPMTRVKSKHLT